MRKKLIAGISTAIMALSLTGCGGAASTYTDYIQATLDCTYRNEQGKYMELTDATSDKAQAVYDDEIEYITNLICYNFAVETDYVNEGTMTGFRAVARDIAAKTKYTVEPAVLSGKTYHLTVVCEPIDYWDITLPEIEDIYDNEFSQRFSEAEDDRVYEALEAEWGIRVLEICGNKTEEIGYKDPVNTIVEITSSDGEYGISDKNWVDIDDLLLDMDSNVTS